MDSNRQQREQDKFVETDEGKTSIRISTENNGHICEDNTSSTPLLADVVFTGVWQDTLNYNNVIIGIKTDEDSAADGLEVQWSTDGITKDDDDVFTIMGNKGKVFTFCPARRYLRLVYTNGSLDQTFFSLQTIFKKGGIKPSSHRIQDSIVAEDDAELVKAVLTGENPSGTFVNFQSTTAGNFKISLEELENNVSVNSNTQLKVTPLHSDGTQGNLITGIDYIDGKSGIDAMTETLQTIEYEHHEIHSGSHYIICGYQSFSNAASTDFALVTPDSDTWTHMTFQIEGTSAVIVEVYEDSDFDGDGTSVISINNNRNSDNITGMTITNDPTINDDGTLIYSQYKGANKSAGFVNRDREIILKQNTKYIFRITNGSTITNIITWCGEWYEHTNKN